MVMCMMQGLPCALAVQPFAQPHGLQGNPTVRTVMAGELHGEDSDGSVPISWLSTGDQDLAWEQREREVPSLTLCPQGPQHRSEEETGKKPAWTTMGCEESAHRMRWPFI